MNIWNGILCVSQKMKMRKLQSHLCLFSVLDYFLSLHFIVHLSETNFFFEKSSVLSSVVTEWKRLAKPIFHFVKISWTSLAVQSLRLPASTSRAQVQSLVGELRSCMPHTHIQKQKTTKFLHWTVLITLFY